MIRFALRRGLLALMFACAPAAAAAFSFALVGDAPYFAAEVPAFAEMLEEINREEVEFVVHVGDFKFGWSDCSDELFESRKRLFETSRHPFIYVPGDNEWSDCSYRHGGRYHASERLGRLRQLFHHGSTSLGGRRFELERQSDAGRYPQYRENVRWAHSNVLFATLNIPGGNNNLADVPDDEYRDRSQANSAWLAASFAIAKRDNLAAVVIFIHANPGFNTTRWPWRSNGYAQFIEELAREAKMFKKPVLLCHGDTHRHRVDRPLKDPLTGRLVANLLRVESYGSPWVQWVRIRVDPAAVEPFSVETGPGSKQ